MTASERQMLSEMFAAHLAEAGRSNTVLDEMAALRHTASYTPTLAAETLDSLRDVFEQAQTQDKTVTLLLTEGGPPPESLDAAFAAFHASHGRLRAAIQTAMQRLERAAEAGRTP